MTKSELDEAYAMAGTWAKIENTSGKLARALLHLRERVEKAEAVCRLVSNQNHSRPLEKTPGGRPKKGTGECHCAVCEALDSWRRTMGGG